MVAGAQIRCDALGWVGGYWDSRRWRCGQKSPAWQRARMGLGLRPLGCENPLTSPHLHLIDQLNDWFSSSFSCSDSDGSRSTKRMDGNI